MIKALLLVRSDVIMVISRKGVKRLLQNQQANELHKALYLVMKNRLDKIVT